MSIKKKKIKLYFITNKKKLKNLIKKIKKKKLFSISLQLKNKRNIFSKKIFAISICLDKKKCFLIPFLFYKKKKKSKNKNKEIFSTLRPIIEKKKIFKIGKNMKKIFHIFQNFKITFNGIKFDLKIQKELKKKEKLNYEEKYYFKKKKKNINKFINLIKKTRKNFFIYKYNLSTFKKEKKEQKILHEIDISLISVLARIERNGILINTSYLKKKLNKTKKKIQKLKKKTYKITKKKINLNSNQQISKFLFKTENLPCMEKTKKGKKSTNEYTLLKLTSLHPLPQIILNYRNLNKIKTNYLKKILQKTNKKTGRIHTSYKQHKSLTGRLTSQNPNIQNIPINKKEGKFIRKAFIAKKKFLIVSADYSQIEIRIIACLAKDKKLLTQLKKNKDIHCLTASKIFKISPSTVSVKQRKIAKTINFSIIYGISPFGLAKKIGINVNKAKKYIHAYFQTYKGIYNYIKKIKKKIKKNGFIKTKQKRKIYIPSINSKNLKNKKSAERKALNASIQGTVADILKIVMIKLDNLFEKKYPKKAYILMQIHDELIFEIHKEKEKKICKEIKIIMEKELNIHPCLKVIIKKGINWKNLK